MKQLFFTLFLMLCLGVNAQTREYLTVDGKQRTMLVYVPTNLPENAPLVITLHGFNQSAQYQMEHTKWNTVAEAEKFIVVYPDYDGGWWDVNGTKDTKFIEKIMEDMNKRYKSDLNRVYVSGFSLGAMMTYHCIEVLANKVAAFAPVSGVRFDNKAPVSPRVVPIIHTHCKGDDVFKWGGDPQHASGGYPYIPDYVKSWAEYFGMNSEPEFIDPYKADDVDLTIYSNPNTVAEVRLLSFDGAGHWHVDADAWGGVSTTWEIWNFCKRYTLNLEEVTPPTLLKAEPENCSFDLPTKNFECVYHFDRPAADFFAKATLTGNGQTIELEKIVFPDGHDRHDYLIFALPEETEIPEGDYTLTLDGICFSPDFTRSYTFDYTFGYEETGDRLNVETIYEPNFNAMLPTANNCLPEGWQRVNTLADGKTETVNASAATLETGSCLKDLGEGTAGLFLTARDITSSNLNYGRITDHFINLPLGKYTLSFDASYWDSGSQRGKAEFDLKLHSKSTRGGQKTVLEQTALKPAGIAEKNGPKWTTAAAHHSFDFKVEKKDNHILNFNISKPRVAVCLGNIKLTTAPTNADRYKGEFLRLLKHAEQIYNQTLETAQQNNLEEEHTQLLNAINRHKNLQSTAPSVYLAAIQDLQEALQTWQQISSTTAIQNITTPQTQNSPTLFNLSGQRIPQNYQGITIRNNKKTLPQK